MTILRTILALEALAARERPLTLGLAAGDAGTAHLVRQFAARRRIGVAGTVAAPPHRVAPTGRAARGAASSTGRARALERLTDRPAAARSGGAGHCRRVRSLGVLEAGDRRRVVHRPRAARGVAAGRERRPRAGRRRDARRPSGRADSSNAAAPGSAEPPPPFRSARRADTRHGTRSRRQPASGGTGAPTAAFCTAARRSARRASSGAATRGRCSATSSPASPTCNSRGRPARWTRSARRSTC